MYWLGPRKVHHRIEDPFGEASPVRASAPRVEDSPQKNLINQRQITLPLITFMELAAAFLSSRVFLTACELEIFSALGEDRRTTNEVAERIGADARATDRLLNALAALGLVDKKEGRFSNWTLANRFLIKGKPEYMAGFMPFKGGSGRGKCAMR
jgi:hypothetical protein